MALSWRARYMKVSSNLKKCLSYLYRTSCSDCKTSSTRRKPAAQAKASPLCQSRGEQLLPIYAALRFLAKSANEYV